MVKSRILATVSSLVTLIAIIIFIIATVSILLLSIIIAVVASFILYGCTITLFLLKRRNVVRKVIALNE